MALTGWSTSNFIRGSAPVTTTPMTMACWAKVASLPGAATQLMFLGQAAAADTLHQHSLRITAGNVIGAVTNDGTTGVSAVTSASPTAGAWFHACGIWTSASSRAAYLNGANSGSDSNSRTPSTINRLSFGKQDNAGNNQALASGALLAEACVWNVALDAAEVAALAAGMPPSKIRPASIVTYLPLVRDLIDFTGLSGVAINGSLSAADHCRIYGRAA